MQWYTCMGTMSAPQPCKFQEMHRADEQGLKRTSIQTIANNYVDLLRFSGNVEIFEVKLLNRKHCGWSFQQLRCKLKLNTFNEHIYTSICIYNCSNNKGIQVDNNCKRYEGGEAFVAAGLRIFSGSILQYYTNYIWWKEQYQRTCNHKQNNYVFI